MIIKRTSPRGEWTKEQKEIAVKLLQEKIKKLNIRNVVGESCGSRNNTAQ